jgi:hypothetical protein
MVVEIRTSLMRRNKMKHKTSINHIPEHTCFVVCPIGDPESDTRRRADSVLNFIIRPALHKSGLTAVRSDEIASPGLITTQIITHILQDKLVIADLSEHNPNVFYELALRHAFRKPVIQILQAGQKLPFDVSGMRTIPYDLDLPSATKAKEEIERYIDSILAEEYEVESPVTIAAKLEELSRSGGPENQAIMRSVIDQLRTLDEKLDHMAGCVCRTDELKEAIPPLVQDKVEGILGRYAEEIDLLKSIRHAGVTGIFKRREVALKAFSSALNDETREIMIIGSSLKGLLQKEEYRPIAEKIRFKAHQGKTKVKFLLTHPIVADFRASQENRRFGEIAREIISSLEILCNWDIPAEYVRLYLGTPTCFAIKTTQQMLINPYPYISVSFDSPCLHVHYSSEVGAERPGYFFDEFNSRHFGAWDSDLAVHVDDYQRAIPYYTQRIEEYSDLVKAMIAKGKEVP